jgi:hypothetical protein
MGIFQNKKAWPAGKNNNKLNREIELTDMYPVLWATWITN